MFNARLLIVLPPEVVEAAKGVFRNSARANARADVQRKVTKEHDQRPLKGDKSCLLSLIWKIMHGDRGL